MSRFSNILAVAVVALLVWIGFELHGLKVEQQRWNGALLGPVLKGVADRRVESPETNAQRREREYQEIARESDDLEWFFERLSRDRKSAR